MILLDDPYVSPFLKETLVKHNIPVILTPAAKKHLNGEDVVYVTESDAIDKLKSKDHFPLYSNSENALGWIAENLQFSDLPGKINLFKDKGIFRESTNALHPEYFFKILKFEQLNSAKADKLVFPVIIKPAVGFFSMGVHRVNNVAEWKTTVKLLHQEIEQVAHLYPKEVLNTSNFIIEEYVTGTEFAIDAYFDSKGKVTVLNIFEHLFGSEKDVSDRVYISSKIIIEQWLRKFGAYLQKIGDMAGLKNFPLHAELRVDDSGRILPIEINPMRFGGWCTTADMTWFSYGFNSYEYFFNGIKPDWNEILKGKENKVYSVIVLDNSTGLHEDQIHSFDYDKLLTLFEHPLELRKINYHKYPVFGFLFTETKISNMQELITILKSNLREFIRPVPGI